VADEQVTEPDHTAVRVALDAFAQRRPDLASRLMVFEVDQARARLHVRMSTGEDFLIAAA
jgi:hypothetical protein